MGSMFRYTEEFNSNISSWNTGSVIQFDKMFFGALSFNVDISSWDISSAITLRKMFQDALMFNIDLSCWDISSVSDLQGMFYKASSFDRSLCWDIMTGAETGNIFELTNGGQIGGCDEKRSCVSTAEVPTAAPLTTSFLVPSSTPLKNDGEEDTNGLTLSDNAVTDTSGTKQMYAPTSAPQTMAGANPSTSTAWTSGDTITPMSSATAPPASDQTGVRSGAKSDRSFFFSRSALFELAIIYAIIITI